MAGKETDTDYNETLKTFSGILSYALPFLQFFYQLFPSTTSLIFLDKSTFLFSSIVTLIVSVIINIYIKGHPYFEITFPFQEKQNKKYSKYLQRLQENKQKNIKKAVNVVKRPKTINQNQLVIYLAPIIFILGFIFIYIGLNGNPNNISLLVLLQAIIYSLFILATTLASSITYETQKRQAYWLGNRQKRISKAISLAIENNALDVIPNIRFKYGYETRPFLGEFITVVEIGERKFQIVTDLEANILKSVTEQFPQTTNGSVEQPFIDPNQNIDEVEKDK